MKINKIEDIKKLNIICTNAEETKGCFSILEKLGLKIDESNNHKDYFNIVRTYIDKSLFFSTYYLNEDCKNINFYDFKKECKKFLKPTSKESLQVEEKAMIEYIKNNKVAIHCPTEDDYNIFTDILEKNGEKMV